MTSRRLTLARHGETDHNLAGRLNGDPAIPVHLTEQGRAQARALGRALAGAAFDLAVRTRFPRTGETLAIVLDGRDVPVVTCPDLDDIALGDCEGRPVAEYRAWRRAHGPAERLPGGGESRLDALRRYLRGYERLLASPARRVLAILHEIPIRFLANAVREVDPLATPLQQVPNAMPYEYEDEDLLRAFEVMRERVRRG